MNLKKISGNLFSKKDNKTHQALMSEAVDALNKVYSDFSVDRRQVLLSMKGLSHLAGKYVRAIEATGVK